MQGAQARIELPLRTRKRALLRLALVEALVAQLATRTLAEVPVEELARAAGISQATFFNYFPSKVDLLTHFVQLWSLRMSALGRRVAAAEASALRALEALFTATAAEAGAAPNVLLEIIAYQALAATRPRPPPVELAERMLLLPEEVDVASLPDQGLGALLPELLGLAVRRGELPAGADVPALTLAAASIFFGTPVVLGRSQLEHLGPLYCQQLRLLWSGARAGEVAR